jgi:hypothetical protein
LVVRVHKVPLASRFPSELGIRGTMRLPNRKEELAHDKCTSAHVNGTLKELIAFGAEVNHEVTTIPERDNKMRNHLTSLFLSFIIASPDPLRIALEVDSAKWFRGVWISGIVVAIGCGLEIWEVVVDLRNWRRYRNKLPAIPDNPGSWLYPMAALGLALVVGGIVSETIFEVLASNADAAIRSHESDVVSIAENDVAIANKQAGLANERAGNAEKQTAELQKGELPRNFDPQKVAAKLRKFGKISVVIYSLSDFEPLHTSALIEAALKDAGWNANGSGSSSRTDSLSTPGVWLEVAPMAEPFFGPRVGTSTDGKTGKTTHRWEPPWRPFVSAKDRLKELARLNTGARALVKVLNAEAVVTKIRPLSRHSDFIAGSPSDSIVIFVSLKPFPGIPKDLRVIANEANAAK